ncbi:hypothetical protein SRHO_G00081540 [Serrasalmus rhombeus]
MTEEVQASIRARHLGPLDQAYFMLDHLEGEAKDEIRYRSRAEREDPQKILSVLKELYGCSKSYVALQESFFGHKQLEGESLQEFSHALLALMDKVKQSAPNIVLNSDVLVRDQFVEHVLDSTLRRELKRLVRQTPGLSMLQVRAEAIQWEREGRPEDSSRGDANNQGIMLGNVIMNVCQCVLWVIHIWVVLPLVPDYRKTSSLRCAEPHIGRGQYWLYPRKPDASFNYSFLSRTVSKGSSPFGRGGS